MESIKLQGQRALNQTLILSLSSVWKTSYQMLNLIFFFVQQRQQHLPK